MHHGIIFNGGFGKIYDWWKHQKIVVTIIDIGLLTDSSLKFLVFKEFYS